MKDAPNAGADNRRFGNRRVDDAFLAEPVDQAFGDFERAAVRADVFANHEDALVARHLVEERLANRFEIGDYRHEIRVDVEVSG